LLWWRSQVSRNNCHSSRWLRPLERMVSSQCLVDHSHDNSCLTRSTSKQTETAISWWVIEDYLPIRGS
jgi:hypothetical protein